jgi:hypothetical protein
VTTYPHHEVLEADAGVRGNYLLNPWIHEMSKRESKRVRIATISLENLNTVPEQLKKIIPHDNFMAKLA